MKCPTNGTLVQSKGLEHAQRMFDMFGYTCVDSDYTVKGKQIVKNKKEPTKKEK
jgi:hypothetical protein